MISIRFGVPGNARAPPDALTGELIGIAAAGGSCSPGTGNEDPVAGAPAMSGETETVERATECNHAHATIKRWQKTEILIRIHPQKNE